jgi:hypothetical protein
VRGKLSSSTPFHVLRSTFYLSTFYVLRATLVVHMDWALGVWRMALVELSTGFVIACISMSMRPAGK